ncbi:MAG: MFS transporter [Promethearchaeota archaeon]
MVSSTKNLAFTSDFKIMLQIIFWNGLGMFYVEFLVPYIATTILLISGFYLGLIVAVQIAGYLISSLIAGFLTDKSSKTQLILIGSFGRGISYLIFYLAIIIRSYFLIALSTFILGMGAGFFWVPFNTMIAEKSSPDSRSHAYGRRSSALGYGIMAGSTVGFLIFLKTNNIGMSPLIIYSPLILFTAANFFAGFQFLYKVDENMKYLPHSSPSSSASSLPPSLTPSDSTINSLELVEKEQWSTGLKIGLIILFLFLIIESIKSSIARPFVQVYFLKNLSSDPNTVLLLYVPAGIIQMLLASKIGNLADRFHPALSITISSVMGALITYFLVNTSSLWLVAVLWTLDNTIVSLGFLAIQNLLSRSTLNFRGKIFGSQETITNLGGIVGPLIGGYAWDNLGMKAPFYLSVIIEFSLIPFYLLAVRFLLPNLLEKTTKEKLADNSEFVSFHTGEPIDS